MENLIGIGGRKSEQLWQPYRYGVFCNGLKYDWVGDAEGEFIGIQYSNLNSDFDINMNQLQLEMRLDGLRK